MTTLLRVTRRGRMAIGLALVVVCAGAPATVHAQPQLEPDTLYVFWSVDCPVCLRQEPYLQELHVRFPTLRLQAMEISRSTEFHQLFREMAAAHGVTPGFVPALFFRERAWIGDSEPARQDLEQTLAMAFAGTDDPAPTSAASADLRLPWIGGIDTQQGSIVLLTVLIAFVDGFNPCSLWVLALLLSLVINSGSRARVALVGLTFLTTTALVYGAFVAGAFTILSFALYLTWVQWAVAAFALLFGLVNIKDYFWFKRGLSFTIDDRHKPGIYRGLRRLRQEDLNGALLVGATAAMALGIALVELPCTAGFPVVWSGIVAARAVPALEFAGLLAIYILVYLLFELALFFSAVFTLQMGRFEEAHGRLLKLYGGTIMVALAAALVVRPGVMNSVGGSLALFAAAMLAATTMWVVHRRVVGAA